MFLGLLAVVGMTLFALIIYLSVILAGKYVIDDQKLVMKATTSLVDQSGEVLTQLYIENREPVAISDIPDYVQEAFISVEDVRFYDHQGIDIRAIARALYRDLLAGAKVEGGSTITQQLAKNVFLTNEKTLLRKTNEVLIAMNLERRYSKDELLEMYLNHIYFGHGAYGIQAASNLYFNKDVQELSKEEGALLAGLPKAPNSFSPITNPEQSKQRRDLVLTLMERQGKLTAAEAKHLRGRTVVVNQNRLTENEAYLTYIDMVLDEARDRYHLTNEEVLTGGYQIVVPMNKEVQMDSFQKLQDDRYFPNGNEDAEAAMVLLDSKTGGVLAVQGGREYVRKGLNRVNVQRQPGSAIKPLAVYAPAMELGTYHPYSLLVDELIEYDGYTPRNYNQEYVGQMTMYDAITHSSNAPAVWLMNEIGIDTSVQALDRFGIHTNDRGLAIALGGLSEGVTPLELASSYSVFANNGSQVEPFFIKAIYTQDGKQLNGEESRSEKVVSPQTSWYMTRMLEAVVNTGTGKSGEVLSPLAGKTGTTSYPGTEGAIMDAWFVGYTPAVVGAIWMGYDTTTSEQHLLGGSAYPTVLYKDIINSIPAQLRGGAFEKPDEVEELAPPVELPSIDDLTATFSIGGRGLSSIHLNWSGKTDERIYYHIYEYTEGERTLMATVVGQTEFFINSKNPFSSKKYEVVPYNSITDQEGMSSNVAEVKFRLGFH
ncbi:penicillin-binding protein [Halalkalibacter okhensis]|uniref:Penicillin-binding protein n=2 Tax=Halalkalibacter okhensis TaxID=333138 RepID=A0A0B0IQS7_9BACI|nr:penicillin-binding protein [Halalkalibacter okhensis]